MNLLPKIKPIVILIVGLYSNSVLAQYPGWQQGADYDINIVMDVENHQYEGELTVMYYNNSPDNLEYVYWHSFFNAFQPGSMMDVRSRTIVDPDSRVGDRISTLTSDEWGWIKPHVMSMNGIPCIIEEDGTIIIAKLPAKLKPGVKCMFKLTWSAQIPKQIRRSGWMNAEDVEFSMTQWFPKLCEYDHEGWHTNPYIGREFHGVWGDYDVHIELPKGYQVAATGTLQSTRKEAKKSGDWHFIAENVIDFAWAADTDYKVYTEVVDSIEMNFIYQPDKEYNDAWKELPRFATKAMAFLNEFVGTYPYPQYTVVQGGDGGMEYPMMTLVTANRSLPSLVGVTVHEMAHSWFQAVVATNESLYEWMDEGFTSWIEGECMASFPAFASEGGDGGEKPIPGGAEHGYSYYSYLRQVESGNEEALSTHADHYTTNRAYGVAAYSKGEVLVEQLGAVIGESMRNEGMREYFKLWSFKHPGPTDFKRVMENISGIELDWYFQYFVNTTHFIDYAITNVESSVMSTTITLERLGKMPMPQDIEVTFTDGLKVKMHIPLVMMRGHRELASDEALASDWAWTSPTYDIVIPSMGKIISRIELDPMMLQADVNRDNNVIDYTID